MPSITYPNSHIYCFRSLSSLYIPTCTGMSSLTRLSFLSLRDNLLSSDLAESNASYWPVWWPSLMQLDLSGNSMSGTLPAGKGIGV